MAEKMYGLTTDPTQDGYIHGPTEDLKALMEEVTEPSATAEIHLLNPDGENEPVYRWLFGTWVDLADELPPVLFENEKGRSTILENLRITDKTQAMLVTGRVTQLSVESKAKAGEYQNEIRSYLQIAPDDLHIHVLVHNPAQLVDMDDLGILSDVLKRIGRTMDMAVVGLAHERADRAIVEKDSNVHIKGVVNTQKIVAL